MQFTEEKEAKTPQKRNRFLSYWKEAAMAFTNTKLLVFAALICALRIAVKVLSQFLPNIMVPGAEIKITFDCYVNAVGAYVCGPILGLAIGAISDTIGALLFPTGPYFFPFIFVEMSSTFVFALFLWKKNITPSRTILSKFAVNFISNILLTSLVMKWMYLWLGINSAYAIINGVRIVKNLILFPIEALLICLILNALLPALKSMRFISSEQKAMQVTKKHVLLVVGYLLLSIALILFYVFFLKDYMKANNFKFF